MKPKPILHESTWPDGSVVEWWSLDEEGFIKHCEDGPAFQKWQNGRLVEREWHQNGKYDRKDGPAVERWWRNGTLRSEGFYENGQAKPNTDFVYAREFKNNGDIWYEYLLSTNRLGNKKRHVKRHFSNDSGGKEWDIVFTNRSRPKEDWAHGPSSESYYPSGQIQYRNHKRDGKYHRVDGLADEGWYENGQKAWENYRKKDMLHRKNGPAENRWHNNGQVAARGWFLEGDWHNPKGPARELWDSSGKKQLEEHMLYGVHYREGAPSFQSWDADGNLIDEKWHKHGVEYKPSAHERLAWEARKAQEAAKAAPVQDKPTFATDKPVKTGARAAYETARAKSAPVKTAKKTKGNEAR